VARHPAEIGCVPVGGKTVKGGSLEQGCRRWPSVHASSANRYKSGIVGHVRAQLNSEYHRYDDPGDIIETESKTFGSPPFALHVKIVGVISLQANGEELELAKDEEFQIILEGGKLPHQAVAVRRIGR
jgi:hypothetical protein